MIELRDVDEPMASLDLAARELLLADLASLAREPRLRAIILVSHVRDTRMSRVRRTMNS